MTGVVDLLMSPNGKAGLLSIIGIALGWVGNSVAGWWKSRDKYHAHVTWQTTGTYMGQRELPVIVIQSIHSLPIAVTRLRVRDGFRRRLDRWVLYCEDGDGPELPRTIEPMKTTKFFLDEDALKAASAQSWPLDWLRLPRVYIGVQTMGRGERLFVAEGGLPFDERHSRYRR